MEENPLNQSAPRRALADTNKSFHSIKFFLGVEVVAVGVFIFLATLLIPPNATRFISALYPAIGAIIGVIIGIGIIFLIMLVRAPYKQRDEARALLLAKPKPVPLTNRKELISAIHALKETAQETVQRLRILRESRRPYPKLVRAVLPHIKTEEEASKDYDESFEKYFEARKELECQQFIAAEAFRQPITIFQGAIDSYVLGKVKNRDTPSDADEDVLSDADVSSKVEELVAEIDAISQPVPDKEDYQKQ